MVGVDLGTRIVKVNVSKVQKDRNPVEDVDVPLDPAALASAQNTAMPAQRPRGSPAELKTLPTPSCSMTHHWKDRNMYQWSNEDF